MVILLVTAWCSGQGYPQWTYFAEIRVNALTDYGLTGSVSNFPILVRLDNDYFDFTQAKVDGADLRFSDGNGSPLPYEIEYWNATTGFAAVWVKLDAVNTSIQTVNIHWGNGGASDASDGAAVFETSNGFSGVWHLSQAGSDATANNNDGTLEGDLPSAVAGLIGVAHDFDGDGDYVSFSSVNGIPVGNSNYTMSGWVNASQMGNLGIVGWGLWGTGNSVNALRLLQETTTGIRHYWWANDLDAATGDISMAWHHVAAFFDGTTRAIYLDGEQIGSNTPSGHNVPNADNMRLGSTNNGEFFDGVLDEIRVSSVARSPAWLRLSYENQKTDNSLVSMPVASGCSEQFSVTTAGGDVNEGVAVSLEGVADCAFFAKWTMVQGNSEVIISNSLTASYDAGRISGDQAMVFRFSGYYDGGWQTEDVNITIKEAVPDPEFTIAGLPAASWDGIDPLVLKPDISNLAAILASSAPDITADWDVSGLYVRRTTVGDSITLSEPSVNGTLSIRLCLDNGGAVVCDSTDLTIAKQVPITVTAPNGGEEIPGGSTYTVTWESAGNITAVHIQYQLDGGSWKTADVNQDNTGSYEWDVPNTPSTTVKVRVIATTGGILDESDAVFTITEGGTGIRITDPQEGVTLFMNGTALMEPVTGVRSVTIMDVSGDKVKTLDVKSGKAVWDGRDSGDELVNRGIYVVRFEGEGIRIYRKIIHK